MSEVQELIEMNGRLQDTTPVPAEVVAQYRGVLPAVLPDLWEAHGLGAWVKGLFRLCLPEDFKPILALVFKADPDFSHTDCHVWGHSAFGKLYFWSERHWVGEINLQRGEVICRKLLNPAKGKNPEIAIATALIKDEPGALDLHDPDGKRIYPGAVKKLGPLAPDECFGFAPALAFGGAPGIDTVRKYKALEHYSILAQAGEFALWDFLARPARAVRPIS